MRCARTAYAIYGWALSRQYYASAGEVVAASTLRGGDTSDTMYRFLSLYRCIAMYRLCIGCIGCIALRSAVGMLGRKCIGFIGVYLMYRHRYIR